MSALLVLPATAVVRCAVLHSRSWEDSIVLPLLPAAAGPEGRGTFVEQGGFTGEEGSQTWLLEKCFGWTGTLIEASPVNFAAMQRAGRNAQMVYGGVCQPAGNLTIAVGEEPSTVTGNLELMSKARRRSELGNRRPLHNGQLSSPSCSGRRTLELIRCSKTV